MFHGVTNDLKQNCTLFIFFMLYDPMISDNIIPIFIFFTEDEKVLHIIPQQVLQILQALKNHLMLRFLIQQVII